MVYEVDSCVQCAKTFGLQLLAVICTEREVAIQHHERYKAFVKC